MTESRREESDQLPEEAPPEQVPDDAGGAARDRRSNRPGFRARRRPAPANRTRRAPRSRTRATTSKGLAALAVVRTLM